MLRGGRRGRGRGTARVRLGAATAWPHRLRLRRVKLRRCLAGSRRRALRTAGGLSEDVHQAAIGRLRAAIACVRAVHAARCGSPLGVSRRAARARGERIALTESGRSVRARWERRALGVPRRGTGTGGKQVLVRVGPLRGLAVAPPPPCPRFCRCRAGAVDRAGAGCRPHGRPWRRRAPARDPRRALRGSRPCPCRRVDVEGRPPGLVSRPLPGDMPHAGGPARDPLPLPVAERALGERARR